MEQHMSKRLTLVLGGVRAGKSSYAQRLAMGGGRSYSWLLRRQATRR